MQLDCHSLEDWLPGMNPTEEVWREVVIVSRYAMDGQPRVSVRILEGPEAGRIVTGLSPGNLRQL